MATLYPLVQLIKGRDHVLKSIERSVNVEGGSKEGSITVTWENLRVTVPNGSKRKPILEGLTGYAQPGRLLAIMGPSGSGKSTLLDALAGHYSKFKTTDFEKFLVHYMFLLGITC